MEYQDKIFILQNDFHMMNGKGGGDIKNDYNM